MRALLRCLFITKTPAPRPSPDQTKSTAIRVASGCHCKTTSLSSCTSLGPSCSCLLLSCWIHDINPLNRFVQQSRIDTLKSQTRKQIHVAFLSSFAASKHPWSTAVSHGVLPTSHLRCGSAPASSNVWIISESFLKAETCSGV